ncbi:lipocalin family protein [Capnocytophaga canimorsus]|uniref:lipocalin family protein n=1 Tax=Capnocytophaga canimorsus TaxID=28188 RepID=UPI0037CD282A
MKKIILMLVATFVVLGCSKKEDNESASFPLNDLYGKWRVTHIQQENGAMFDITSEIAEKAFAPTYATFNNDGTYSGEGYFGTGTGTYKVSGKTITCYIQGQEYLKYEILDFSKTEATLDMRMTGEKSATRIKVKKQ